MDRTAIYETGGETEREHHFPYSKRNSRAGILPHDAISPVRLTYQGRVRQPGKAAVQQFRRQTLHRLRRRLYLLQVPAAVVGLRRFRKVR